MASYDITPCFITVPNVRGYYSPSLHPGALVPQVKSHSITLELGFKVEHISYSLAALISEDEFPALLQVCISTSASEEETVPEMADILMDITLELVGHVKHGNRLVLVTDCVTNKRRSPEHPANAYRISLGDKTTAHALEYPTALTVCTSNPVGTVEGPAYMFPIILNLHKTITPKTAAKKNPQV